MSKPRPTDRQLPTIRVKPHTYQPSKAEMEEPILVSASMTPEDVARAVTRPVNIVYED